MRIGFGVSTVFVALSAAAYAGGGGIHDDKDGLQLAGTIPIEQVEGRMDHMAANLDGRQLFVAILGSDLVEGVDVESEWANPAAVVEAPGSSLNHRPNSAAKPGNHSTASSETDVTSAKSRRGSINPGDQSD